MKILVAVSGGVDSMVLLHKLVHAEPKHEVIVAHVDHGIRADSDEDARLVEKVAQAYGCTYMHTALHLGPHASEDLARQKRYAFLHACMQQTGARKIYTAHHMDDIAETIAINITRGTGWRGLACLSAADVERPLLHMTKQEIIAYARMHALEWREDATNNSDVYLRNRMRKKLANVTPDTVQQLAALRARQVELSQEIDAELASACMHAQSAEGHARYVYIQVPHACALEMLRHITDGKLTRPQATRALLAIKTYAPGKVFDAGSGVMLRFTKRHFTVTA